MTSLEPLIVNQTNPTLFEMMVLDYQGQLLSTVHWEQLLRYLDFNNFKLGYPGYETVVLATTAIAMSLALSEKLNMIDKVYDVKSRLTSICITAWVHVLDVLNTWASRGDVTLINGVYLFILKMQCSNM